MRDAAVDNFGSKNASSWSGYNKAGYPQVDYEDWQDVMDANAGAWFMAKAVGSYWIENNIKENASHVSVRGRHGNISGYTDYVPPKALRTP